MPRQGSINKAYSWAINTCRAPNVGYPPDNHLDWRNQKKVNGITYYDCSSFINYALLAGGFETPAYAPKNNAFTTYTMGAVLLQLGFTELTPSSTFVWKPGDIGLNVDHTEMCYSEGVGTAVFMGSHTSNAALANQVSIGNSSGDTTYRRTFNKCYRFQDGATYEGYSAHVVAALAGNAWGESSINPDTGWIYSGYGAAWGMFQWDYAAGRAQKLKDFLDANGYEEYDGDGQLQFLIEENTWVTASWQGHGVSKYKDLQDYLKSDSTDIADLTLEFMAHWERPANDSSLQERIDFATKAYFFILDYGNDERIKEWRYKPSPDYHLTENEALENAVMMYRFLSAGGDPGGEETKVKHKMPVWMMIKYREIR